MSNRYWELGVRVQSLFALWVVIVIVNEIGALGHGGSWLSSQLLGDWGEHTELISAVCGHSDCK